MKWCTLFMYTQTKDIKRRIILVCSYRLNIILLCFITFLLDRWINKWIIFSTQKIYESNLNLIKCLLIIRIRSICFSYILCLKLIWTIKIRSLSSFQYNQIVVMVSYMLFTVWCLNCRASIWRQLLQLSTNDTWSFQQYKTKTISKIYTRAQNKILFQIY